MNLAELESYILAQPGAILDWPFGPDVNVYKVGGKMFALLSAAAESPRLSLKIEPAEGLLLCGEYAAIQPGYHLNKRHWVTLNLDGSLADGFVRDLIAGSYSLVLKGLSRAVRASLQDLK